MNDFERMTKPYPPPPPQNKKALALVGIGLLFVACILLGVLLYIMDAVRMAL